MALAESAELIVTLRLKDELTGAVKSANAQVQQNVDRLAQSVNKAGASIKPKNWLGWQNETILGFGKLRDAAGNLGDSMRVKLGNAADSINTKFSNLGNNIRKRFSNLGADIRKGIGVGIGFGLTSVVAQATGSIVSFFTEASSKAQQFGATSEQLGKLLNLPIDQSSRLVDVLDKFGISGDAQIKVIGMLERNAGKYGKSVKDAAKFQQQFGLNLLGTNGQLAPANELLARTIDFYNSSATASQKATALQALYGRGWQQLLPLLVKSRKEFEAEQKSALSLSPIQRRNLKAAIAAQKDLNDAMGDLQVVIGARLAPVITSTMRSLAGFLDENRDKIADLAEGVLNFARQIGRAIKTYVLPIGRAIASAWAAVPEPLKQLLIGGVIGNKVLKMTIGFDPLDIVRKGVTDSIGGLFSRGSPTNPMFTKEIGLPGVGGKGGGIPPLLGVAGAALGGVGIAALFKTFIQDPALEAQSSKIVADAQRQIGSKPGQATLTDALHAVQDGLRKLQSLPGANELYGKEIADLQRVKAMYITAIGPTGGRAFGGSFGLPKGATSFTPLAGLDRLTVIPKKLDVLHEDFVAQRAILKEGTDAQKAAAAKKLATDVEKGVGNVKNTKSLAAELRARALQVRDPQARVAILAAAQRITNKVPGREWIQRQITAAHRIAQSTDNVRNKVNDLKAIQRTLIAHHDSAAARQVGTLISGFGATVAAIHGIRLTVNTLTSGTGVSRTGPSQRQHTGSGTGTGGYVDRGGGRGGGRASGGPVWPGGTWTVGEAGPERLDIYPSGMGRVTPLASGRPSYSTMLKINMSYRDQSTATVVHKRIGPSPADTGAR